MIILIFHFDSLFIFINDVFVFLFLLADSNNDT